MEDVELLRLRALAKAKADRERAQLAEQEVPMPEQSLLEKAKDVGLKGLDVAGRAMDIPAGAVRAGVAGGLEALTGKELVDVGAEDIFKGNVPSSSEIMAKLDIPEGYSLSDILPGMYSETGEGIKLQRGGFLDPSARGAVGLALDVATDPLTYASLGTSALAKVGKAGKVAADVAEKALTPIGTLAGKRSKTLYKKAFEKVDTNLKPLNKPYSISEILSKDKFKGNLMEATERVSKINQEAGTDIGKILKQASEKGAVVDMTKEFEPALTYAQELRKMPTPEAAKLADDIDNRVMYAWEKSGGKMPVDKANELKSFINDQIKNSGFAAGDEAALSTQARKAIAGDLSEGIKSAVKSQDKELYNKLEKTNKVYSSTSGQVQDEMFKQAKTVKELNEGGVIPGVSQVDLMLAGLGATTGSAEGWLPLIAKKAGQAAMSTKGRTSRAAFGKMLEEQKNIIDPIARQALWTEMFKQKGNEQ